MCVASSDVCFSLVKTVSRKSVFFPVVRSSLSVIQDDDLRCQHPDPLDEPTNHLDMESITALNNGLIKFPGVILFHLTRPSVCADNCKPYHGNPS